MIAALTTCCSSAAGRGRSARDELGWLWTLIKMFAVSFVVIWLRVAYPRLREDQLQRLCWLGLVPLALVQLVLTAGVKVAMAVTAPITANVWRDARLRRSSRTLPGLMAAGWR